MNPCTVLIVDDEPHILHVMGLKLTRAGYQVITAADGEEALALSEAHQPALVITDYQMPGMTGVALSERLRQAPSMQDIPVLLVTAHGFGLNPGLLAQTNIAEMISKPFSPREVLDKVQMLTGSQVSQEAA